MAQQDTTAPSAGLTRATCPGAGSGDLLPDIALPSDSGAHVPLDLFAGRRNLVLLLTGADDGGESIKDLLNDLTSIRDRLADEEAELLVIRAGAPVATPGAGSGPKVLFDSDDVLHRSVGAMDKNDTPTPCIIVADRYREIYHIYRPTDSGWPPTGNAILEWLVFMNIQCPECGVPEW